MTRSLLLCVAPALAVAFAAASDAADAPPAEPAPALTDFDAVAASNEEPVVEEPAASAAPARRPPSKSAPRKKKVAKVIAYDAVEAQRDALVAQLRAQGWKGSAEDIEIRAAPRAVDDRRAVGDHGALMLSPLGVAGIVAGGALGGAVGTATDRAHEDAFGRADVQRARAEAAAGRTKVRRLAREGEGHRGDGRGGRREVAAASAAPGLPARAVQLAVRRRHCRVRGSQEAWASMNLGVVACPLRRAAPRAGPGDVADQVVRLRPVREDGAAARRGRQRARAKYRAAARVVRGADPEVVRRGARRLVRNKYQRLKWAAPEVREAASAARRRQAKEAGGERARRCRRSAREFAARRRSAAAPSAGGARWPPKMSVTCELPHRSSLV